MHLMIGTPMYSGLCFGEYARSMIDLCIAFDKSGHKVTLGFPYNDSLIQKARNSIAWKFLKETDASHLMFIDADVKFKTSDVADMIRADKPLILGSIPLKDINWNSVRKAVLDNKKNLEDYSGYFNLSFLAEQKSKSIKQPFEIEHGGTAFMLIKREVFEELDPYVEHYRYSGFALPNTAIMGNYFSVDVVDFNGDKLLLSEDIGFCYKYKKIGGKVWAAPWCELTHMGTYEFNGKQFIME